MVAEAVAAFQADPEGSLPGRPSLNPFVCASHGEEGLHGASRRSHRVCRARPSSSLSWNPRRPGRSPAPPDNTVGALSRERGRAQTRSIFTKLEDLLLSKGFQWEDIFYVRGLLLSPDPETGETDFAGFGETFSAHFAGRHPQLRPSAHNVGGPRLRPQTGRLVEVEIYDGRRPTGRGPFVTFDTARAHPGLQMTGTPKRHVSVPALRSPAFSRSLGSSGAIGTASEDLHEESISTPPHPPSAHLRDLGLDFDATVHLRAYPVWLGKPFPQRWQIGIRPTDASSPCR